MKETSSTSTVVQCFVKKVNLMLLSYLRYVLQKQPPEVFCKKTVLKNFAIFTGKHLFFRVSFLVKLQVCNFIEKETLTQMFFCQYCGIFKNTYFQEPLRRAAPGFSDFGNYFDGFIFSYKIIFFHLRSCLIKWIEKVH